MTLHLVLKRKWFDMIAVGEKREEYRQIKPFWTTRLFCHEYKFVCFHRAYTNTTITYQIENILVGFGNQNWGAPGYRIYIIKLSEKQ